MMNEPQVVPQTIDATDIDQPEIAVTPSRQGTSPSAEPSTREPLNGRETAAFTGLAEDDDPAREAESAVLLSPPSG